MLGQATSTGATAIRAVIVMQIKIKNRASGLWPLSPRSKKKPKAVVVDSKTIRSDGFEDTTFEPTMWYHLIRTQHSLFGSLCFAAKYGQWLAAANAGDRHDCPLEPPLVLMVGIAAAFRKMTWIWGMLSSLTKLWGMSTAK